MLYDGPLTKTCEACRETRELVVRIVTNTPDLTVIEVDYPDGRVGRFECRPGATATWRIEG